MNTHCKTLLEILTEQELKLLTAINARRLRGKPRDDDEDRFYWLRRAVIIRIKGIIANCVRSTPRRGMRLQVLLDELQQQEETDAQQRGQVAKHLN